MINGLEFVWGFFPLHPSASALPNSTGKPEPTTWGSTMADGDGVGLQDANKLQMSSVSLLCALANQLHPS